VAQYVDLSLEVALPLEPAADCPPPDCHRERSSARPWCRP